MTMTDYAAAPADELAVRALIDRLAQAWGQGDADAYAAIFTEDADYTIFDGTHYKGRRAIADVHRPLFERFLKGTRLIYVEQAVRFLTPDVALILTKGAAVRSGQEPSGRRLSSQTTVAVRGADGWQLAAFQNGRYRPFGKSLLGKLLRLVGLAPAAEPAA